MSARPRVRHKLKCWPEFFEPTLRGIMRFQLRRDDRPEGFQVGDELLLKEWDPTTKIVAAVPDGEGGTCIFPCQADMPKGYTGREVLVRVDYVMDGDTLLSLGLDWEAHETGFVIMSVSRN